MGNQLMENRSRSGTTAKRRANNVRRPPAYVSLQISPAGEEAVESQAACNWILAQLVRRGDIT